MSKAPLSTAILALLLSFASTAQPQAYATVGAWGNNGLGQTVVDPAAAGAVVAWGENGSGQTDVPLAAQLGVMAIAAGENYTVALKKGGALVAWGANSWIGTAVPVAVANGVTAIAAGDTHMVALQNDGAVVAWGGNWNGQVTGTPALAEPYFVTASPVTLGGQVLTTVIAIAAGGAHTVALKSDGTVAAWGANEYGQVTGTPSLADPYSDIASPVTLSGQVLTGVTAIAAGGSYYGGHTVALKNDGSVIAWGATNMGQTTVPVAAQSGVKAIAAGYLHTVALKSDGSVVAWGTGHTVVPMAAQTGVTAIAAGNGYTLALKKDGTVVAWGADGLVQTNVPTGLSGVTAIAAGNNHAAALIGGQPIILDQPQSRTNLVGTTATFHVGTTGTPPLNYQWSFNNLANHLPGATNDTLILPNLQGSNAGFYRVTITNHAGSVQSVSARLTVAFPPLITNQPASQTSIWGSWAGFGVGASGTPLLSYQWYLNDVRLPGQTHAALTVPSVSDLTAGDYFVTVTNPYGAATSLVARLSIDLSSQVVIAPNASATNDGNSSRTSPSTPGQVRDMQIFDASQFRELAGPSFLTQFAYRPDMLSGASGPRLATLRVYASTTTQAVAGLSMTFAANLGTNNALVFDGTTVWQTRNLPGPGNTRQFDVVFPFTTPFLYDPAAGNLVLDLQFSASGDSITFDADSGSIAGEIINNSSSTAITAERIGVAKVIQFTFRRMLSARLTDTNTVLISWPAASTGFELQQNAHLGTTNWVPIGTEALTVGLERQVIVSGPTGTQFYRLYKP